MYDTDDKMHNFLVRFLDRLYSGDQWLEFFLHSLNSKLFLIEQLP